MPAPVKISFGSPQVCHAVSKSHFLQTPGQQCAATVSGLYGQSTVREVDVASGKVLRSQPLPAADFGEGLVKFGSR